MKFVIEICHGRKENLFNFLISKELFNIPYKCSDNNMRPICFASYYARSGYIILCRYL